MDAATKKKYDERLTRVRHAVTMDQEPDRVPIMPLAQTYPILRQGHTMAQVLYDMEIAKADFDKYFLDYEPDMARDWAEIFAGMGPIFEKAGLKWLKWAGQPGVEIDKNSIHQYIEKEYMTENEYPELNTDMTGWYLNKYLPRSFTAFEALEKVAFKNTTGYGWANAMIPFADPDVRKSFETMAEIGEMYAKWTAELEAYEIHVEQDLGFPFQCGPKSTAAFDQVSDHLRGTIGTMMDVMMQPEAIKEAMEHFYPMILNAALAQQDSPHVHGEWVFIPMHKGFDGFLGPEQYDEFYWPTFKRLIEDLVARGCTPFVYTEGKYDSRLERIAELPAHKCVYHFEDVDMAEAKRIVGKDHCICGAFDTRLLEEGTVQQVKDAVKAQIDLCAPGGGYIFDIGDTLDDCKPENVEAMFETVKDYGRY